MKPCRSVRLLLLGGLVLAGTLAGCRRAAEPSAVVPPHGEVTEFSEREGLLLGRAAAEALTLDSAVVGFGPPADSRTWSGHLFRLASEPDQGRYRTGFDYATFTVPGPEADLVRTGQKVFVSAEGAGPVEGVVHRVDGQMRPLGGRAEVLVEMPPLPGAEHGRAVSARWTGTRTGDAVLSAPAGAVLTTAKGPVVYVRNGDRWLRTEVVPGREHEGRVEIVDGLYEGDEVAVQGARGLYLAELQAVNAGVGCAHGH